MSEGFDPENKEPDNNHQVERDISTVSGGVNIGGDTQVGHDLVGRDNYDVKQDRIEGSAIAIGPGARASIEKFDYAGFANASVRWLLIFFLVLGLYFRYFVGVTSSNTNPIMELLAVLAAPIFLTIYQPFIIALLIISLLLRNRTNLILSAIVMAITLRWI